MASIAVRVEIGEDQDSGVARSSRAGTKRSVKAGPTSRGCPGRSGRVPRIQTFRRPFFRRTVVMVAVDTLERVAIASGVRDIEQNAPVGFCWRAHLAGHVHHVKGFADLSASCAIIAAYRRHAVNLLNLLDQLDKANSTPAQNALKADRRLRVCEAVEF
jgi:hypothetical protein